MSRLIFVPQYPTSLRYQEFFISEFPKKLSKYYDEIVILGKDFSEGTKFNHDEKMFSPIKEAILMEEVQVNEYLDLDLREDDTLLLMDISFPALFCNILYHKPVKNSYAYCHATSLNNFDYFKECRNSKFLCETAHSKLFKKVFVGSEYHKNKLNWTNTFVIGLPKPPFKTFKEKKIYEIISVSRPSIQKVNKKLEKIVVKEFGEILRKTTKNWEQYYKFLSQANVVLLSGKEETFGYQVMESVMNNTVPLAPNKFSYPELLSNEYLYNNYEELRDKILKVFRGELLPPKELQNQNLVDNFYFNLYLQMKA